MNIVLCPSCGAKTKRAGKTTANKQRWQCLKCKATFTNQIDNRAKLLGQFLKWLISKEIQLDMVGEGRSFRRKTAFAWELWALPPLIDEIHDVVYVDGIHLGRKAVVLIACNDTHVLGWYLARSENANAWQALLSRIAAPAVVVSDGGSGFKKAVRAVWSGTRIQRCTFHAYSQVVRYTTRKPHLRAGIELYGLARGLLTIHDVSQAQEWLETYYTWCERWNKFLKEQTIVDGHKTLTHYRLG
jgi:hypothetical protein